MKIDLIYPVDLDFYSQGFGANPGFYADPKYGGIKGHNGLDFFAQHGTPVYATHDGIAEYQVDPAGGCGVVIMSHDKSFKTIYWHLANDSKYLSPILNNNFSKVETGDIIGYADNTGASTGDHLHFGLKLCLNGETIDKQNGFLGAVNPEPYLNGFLPRDFLKLKNKVSILQKLIELWKTLKGLRK